MKSIYDDRIEKMDKIIGFGDIKANEVVVYSNRLTQTLGIKKRDYSLSFDDGDAIPFGRFPVYRLNGEIRYKFYIGTAGMTHGSLLQKANEDNQKILGGDWMRNPKYNKISSDFKIQSAGRLWVGKNIIVMRDPMPTPNIVEYAVSELSRNGFPCSQYSMLYSDDDHHVHLCLVSDYISGCASQYGYKTQEDLSFLNAGIIDKDVSKNNGNKRQVTQAEINFYKKYGIGDSVLPKRVMLTESQLVSIVSRIVRKILT